MKNYQIRNITSKVETKSEESGEKVLLGFIPYNSASDVMHGIREFIAPTAFNKTLADGSNVYALVDHDSSKVLGSTKSGSLKLESKDDGLYIYCTLPNTSYANDAYELMSKSIVSTMSFGFSPIKVDSSTDASGSIEIIREAKLYEVSFLVPFPAYAETDSLAQTRALLLEKRSIDIDNLASILVKDNLDEGDKTILVGISNQINEMVGVKQLREDPEPLAVPPEPPNALSAETLKSLSLALKELNDFVNK